ncbi:MAG: hypothetical protein LKG40_05130 [Lachnospiraceae bacterium]|jgi:hypothetical protein|nr:hypothetical protein [Lachnospiraceae bacterium]
MARWAEKLPSDKEKQVYNGTAGRKVTIKNRKASSRWHADPKMLTRRQDTGMSAGGTVVV